MKNFQNRSVDQSQKKIKTATPLVTEFMTKKLITFKPDTEIHDVIDALLKNRITGAPVLNDNGDIVGLIDDKDCLKVLFAGAYHNHPIAKNTVDSFMSNIMKTISDKTDIMEVANIFLQTNFKRLLVMNAKGKLVGQISRRDALRAVQAMH